MQPLHLNLLDLQEGQCRWPFGDGPFTFCGHPVHEDGKPYCAEHHARAHLPVRPRVDTFIPARRRAA